MNQRVWLAVLLLLAVVAAGVWVFRLGREQSRLTHEAGRLAVEIGALLPGPPRPVNPTRPATVPEEVTAADPAIDGESRLSSLIQTLSASVENPLMFDRFGPKHPRMQKAVEQIAKLRPDEWAALVGTDSRFSLFIDKDERATDPQEAVRLFVVRQAFANLIKADPVRALRFTETAMKESFLDAARLQNSIDHCLKSWVNQDPEAAFLWMNQRKSQLPGGEARVGRVLRDAARIDFAAAWTLAGREEVPKNILLPAMLGAARSRDDLDFIMAVLEREPTAEGSFVTLDAEFTSSLPEGTTYFARACEEGVRRLLLSRGFEEAKIFMERWAREETVRGAVLPRMTRNIVYETGPAAHTQADWLVAQFPEDQREGQIAKLVDRWADENFIAPATWLQRQPSSQWRDAGLVSLCHKLAPFDVASAVEWAALIQDVTRREAVLSQVQTLATP